MSTFEESCEGEAHPIPEVPPVSEARVSGVVIQDQGFGGPVSEAGAAPKPWS